MWTSILLTMAQNIELCLQADCHTSNADLIIACKVKQSWTLKGRKESPPAMGSTRGPIWVILTSQKEPVTMPDIFQSRPITRIWNTTHKEPYSENDVPFHLASSSSFYSWIEHHRIFLLNFVHNNKQDTKL